MTPDLIIDLLTVFSTVLSIYLAFLVNRANSRSNAAKTQVDAQKAAFDSVIAANTELRVELERANEKITALEAALNEQRQNHSSEIERLTALWQKERAQVAYLQGQIEALTGDKGQG